jgi:hypothetical protein
MRRLFDLSDPVYRAHARFPQWPYADKGLVKAVRDVRDYYSHQVRAVHAEHLLVRMLVTLGVSMNLDPQVYYDRVTDLAYRLAAEFRLPSPTSRGGVQYKNTFYGHGVADVIAIQNYPQTENIKTLMDNWSTLESIKLYRHPLVDLSLSIPDSKQSTRTMGNVCVAIIDLPKLALQYRCWFEVNKVRDNPLTIEHFIAMHVLPNMLWRQTDITIANRIFATAKYDALPPAERINPFSIPRYEKVVDDIAKTYLSQVVTKAESFDQMLAGIPQLQNGDYRQMVTIPEGPLTEPMGWVWLLAQLPALEFLVKVNKETGNKRNQSYLREIRLALLDYTSSKSLSRYMTDPMLTDTLLTIQRDIIPYIQQT